MTVFLRWGVFGILSVAALLYAYNASKDIAKRRPLPAVAAVPQPDDAQPTPATPATPATPISSGCEVEVAVAQRAIDARDAGDPLDRLLRTSEIAFEADQTRRERLTRVAERWFSHAEAIGPFSVRRVAAAECATAEAVRTP
jgi:hypothetical protein